MEEDAGKSLHDKGNETYIDLNRCGVPLIEIVTEPDLSSGAEASLYLFRIHQLVQYLEICDGNMEEGSLRCDANISIRLKDAKELGTKTEVKNMNSFKNVEKAINYEIERQIDLVEDGEKIVQQTLLWSAELNEAIPMRSKEEAHDYRYFPEPDLFPVVVNSEWKKELSELLPELPEKRKERFIRDYKIPNYDAEILTQSKYLADYYESVLKVTDDYKSASNWVMVDVLKVLNDKKIDIKDFPVAPKSLGSLINLINDGTISGKIAKDIFQIMCEEKKDPIEIVTEKKLFQIKDESELERIIEEVVSKNYSELQQYFGGKEKVFGFFVGQVMKMTQGKANPKSVNEILKKKLNQLKENKI
jgi:aspartyl-tRNA(Asn)/glutamyl-tRNA(Gln) amidotransferase subunit B